MVTNNERKAAIKDVAYKMKLNTKKIDGLRKVADIKVLLVNPLVCTRCGKTQSVVGKYMTCDPCEEKLSRSDKKFINEMGGMTPTYLDDYEALNPPVEVIAE